jgi:hypothetical protein
MNPPQVTEKNKKNEILTAYYELLNKLDQRNRQNRLELPVEDEKRKQDEVLIERTSNFGFDSIVKDVENFNDIQNKLVDAFKSLTEKLKEEIDRLNEVKSAVNIEQQKLQNIYGIKDIATSLQEFLKLKEEEKMLWELQKEELKKQQKRDVEEYEYNMKLKRKKEEDDYSNNRQKIKELFDEEMRNLRDQVVQKESALEAQLSEFEELKKLKEQFETLKQKAIDNALTAQSKVLEESFANKSAMEKQKNDAEKSLLLQTLKALEEKIKDNDREIVELKKDARMANNKAQELALTIIQSQKKETKNSGVEEKDNAF